jgi:hypothetical protein
MLSVCYMVDLKFYLPQIFKLMIPQKYCFVFLCNMLTSLHIAILVTIC